jgi:serine/threonine protein kinase
MMVGQTIGPYSIIAKLGEGGMGEVYRATDTKLKRLVAIKILPASFATDHDRLARFQREAEVLASLNHPNIAGIYGLEESGGVSALVMELVEGEELSRRIARGAIALDEALPYARQIAEALEAAHEQGIVHRDLKPANIKVRPDGTAKVLDFGLAKALESAAGSSPNVSQSPTFTTPAMTQAGMIMGTTAYMSPEQARGRPVDRRTDIWAFGCVLYEMLTGGPAFSRETVSDTLGHHPRRAGLERPSRHSATPHAVAATMPRQGPAHTSSRYRRSADRARRLEHRRQRRCSDQRGTVPETAFGSDTVGCRPAARVGGQRSHLVDRLTPTSSGRTIASSDYHACHRRFRIDHKSYRGPERITVGLWVRSRRRQYEHLGPAAARWPAGSDYPRQRRRD